VPAEPVPGFGEPVGGEEVTLVPVLRGQAERALAGDLGRYVAGRGWPHADTRQALAFLDEGGLAWLVVDAAGAVVGEVGTKAPPDTAGLVEIGYGLAATSRGRGLGTRAVRALLLALAERPDITTVVAHVLPTNTPSAALLDRLGFRCTGHIDGELVYRRAL
jgi:RimJ/RimL family protein N-acetyltransferase